jgi:hypothetical protein
MTSEVPSIVSRAAALLEKHPVSWRRAQGGYTPAERYVVQFSDDSSCFVKAATNAYTTKALRDEYTKVYSRLQAPFLPRLYAWEDDEQPLLVLEDLSQAEWPPPWTPSRIEAVRRALDEVHATSIEGLPPLEELEGAQDWGEVAADPAPFLSLGLVTPAWLERSLPALQAAANAAPFHGDAFLHVDIRSDNICLCDGRVIFIDWNFACRGNPDFDLAAWLPSLQHEGGPPPETILPHAPELAAWVSGYFAANAGLTGNPGLVNVRKIQLAQLKTALPWSQRALGLPPLDGALL